MASAPVSVGVMAMATRKGYCILDIVFYFKQLYGHSSRLLLLIKW